MAAAAVKNHLLPKLTGSKSNERNGAKESNAHDAPHRDQEKQFIAQWEDESRPLEPDEITIDHKRLGHSSSSLRPDDFDLIKTLGTGTHSLLPSCGDGSNADSLSTGTFARVWLAKLAKAKGGDDQKVFALKVLRKVDGASIPEYSR